MNAGKTVGVIVLVVSVLFLAGMFLYREFIAAGYDGYGYGHGGYMMGGMGGMGMGWLMIVFWGLVLFGLILMIQWLLTAIGNEKRGGTEAGAQAVLKKRYASGEIGREQYEQMRKELSL